MTVIINKKFNLFGREIHIGFANGDDQHALDADFGPVAAGSDTRGHRLHIRAGGDDE